MERPGQDVSFWLGLLSIALALKIGTSPFGRTNCFSTHLPPFVTHSHLEFIERTMVLPHSHSQPPLGKHCQWFPSLRQGGPDGPG
ncbi:hypothetical protein CLU79DRAFT_762564 [Phycomyces nitens]|nr:hypothetical protein CLU79DRAFT_762564 [Phycomyces nitens]